MAKANALVKANTVLKTVAKAEEEKKINARTLKFLPAQKLMRVSVPPPQSLAFDVSLSSSPSLPLSLSPALRALFFLCTFSLCFVSVSLTQRVRSFVCLFSVCLLYTLPFYRPLCVFVYVCVHQVSTETPSCCCLCMVRAAAVAVAVAASAAAILLSVVCRLLHPMFISYVSWTHVTDPRRN